MGGCLWPSIWTATIFKNFLIVPLKATIFENNHYLNRSFINCPPLLRWWPTADLCKKPVAWRRSTEKSGFNILTSLSCGGADRRRKVGGLTDPVVAASQIIITRWQTANHSNQAWAYREPCCMVTLKVFFCEPTYFLPLLLGLISNMINITHCPKSILEFVTVLNLA
jgi:hypothetical protein